MTLSAISKLSRAFPAAMLARAAKEAAAGYVSTKAKDVTIEMVREVHRSGKSVQEGFRMAEPDVQAFLINMSQRCPWLLDEITFDVFIDWIAEGNSELAAQILGDPGLVMWGARTWAEGIQEIRRLAGV